MIILYGYVFFFYVVITFSVFLLFYCGYLYMRIYFIWLCVFRFSNYYLHFERILTTFSTASSVVIHTVNIFCLRLYRGLRLNNSYSTVIYEASYLVPGSYRPAVRQSSATAVVATLSTQSSVQLPELCENSQKRPPASTSEGWRRLWPCLAPTTGTPHPFLSRTRSRRAEQSRYHCYWMGA